MTETARDKTLVKGQLLPGVAGIAMYMLLIAMVGVIGVFRGQFAGSGVKYAVLPLCTMIVVGVFGLLRMRRWGWALVLAGTLLLSFGYVVMSRMTKNPAMLVMAGLDLCLFLYLVRTEVRDRMR